MLKTYHGSCHCGAVTFETDLDLAQGTYRCNCSICRHCGVRGFGVGNETPFGKMYGVNLGCLDDASDEELAEAPITYVDGRNDKWQNAPDFFAHL